MSRAFVKEPDGDAAGDCQPELPQSPHPNHVTAKGLAALQDRFAALADEKRALAAKQGDLAARSHLALVDRELRYVEERLRRAIPVDPRKLTTHKVGFSAIVTVEDDVGKRRDYQIVGEDEADPEDGKVSWVSPLARALEDAEVGDSVTWRRPVGDLELEVVAIRYPTAEKDA